ALDPGHGAAAARGQHRAARTGAQRHGGIAGAALPSVRVPNVSLHAAVALARRRALFWGNAGERAPAARPAPSGGRLMAVVVGLGKIHDQGIQNMAGFRERHKEAVKRAESRGAKVLASYALLGPYDFLVLLDSPDAATVMKVLTKESQGGNIRYE